MSQIKFDYTVNFKRPVNSNDLIYYKEESEIENGKNKTISDVFLEMSGILKSDVNNEQLDKAQNLDNYVDTVKPVDESYDKVFFASYDKFNLNGNFNRNKKV